MRNDESLFITLYKACNDIDADNNIKKVRMDLTNYRHINEIKEGFYFETRNEAITYRQKIIRERLIRVTDEIMKYKKEINNREVIIKKLHESLVKCETWLTSDE